MDTLEKIRILSDAAKYDVSCSSSGSQRENSPNGIGNAAQAGICHSWSDDGRCISLLKILYTNHCVYDCVYCRNRHSNDIPRAAFTPDELINLTINFYRRNYIEGLFLSSGIMRDPEYTMQQMLKVVRSLRTEHRFNGYIHLKAIPGCELATLHEAGLYVDRMSVNIELPSEDSLKLLAPQKSRDNILLPMNYIGQEYQHTKDERKNNKKKPLFVPAGQSTQLIVGATPESDFQIVRLMEQLYQRYALKRVYYSAYIPVNQDNRLPVLAGVPLLREHRLYQADWLLRFYGFKANEILDETAPYLDDQLDPKILWALRNLHHFPVEVNNADYEMLLRVPGIGVKSALTIIKVRRSSTITFDTLKKIGIALKRARYFISCNGSMLEKFIPDPAILRRLLTGGEKSYQLTLF